MSLQQQLKQNIWSLNKILITFYYEQALLFSEVLGDFSGKCL